MLSLLLAAAPATPNAPPPPIQAASRLEAVLLDFVPGAVDCGGANVRAVSTADPLPVGMMLPPGSRLPDVELSFHLASDGRPLDIGTPKSVPGTGVFLNTRDLPAALSLWRFASGGRERKCTIRFALRQQPMATARVDGVYRFAALIRSGDTAEREAMARIRPADCVGRGTPTVLLRGYPDYQKLPPMPGAPAYSVVAFDIDSAGVPVNVGTLTGSGQAQLDEASRDAVARSRFGEGDARERCTLPFVQWPRPPVEAPEDMNLEALRPEGASCGDVKWAAPPRGDYPIAFQRRAIEGWAIVRFDLTDAGRPVKPVVVASAPAAAFGENALASVYGARAEGLGVAQTGCVERVRYRMPR